MTAELERATRRLASADPGERVAAARDLEAHLTALLAAGATGGAPLAERLLPALVKGLGDTEKGVQVHCANCLQLLAPHSGAVLPALREALTPPDERRAWGAAFVAGRLGFWSAGVGRALAAAMGAPDRDIRWAAADLAVALGRAHPECVEMAKETLQSPVPAARKMAAYCLGAMGAYADVAGALAGRLADPDRDVRRAAVLALNRLPRVPADVQRQVVSLRQDPDQFVRRAADAVARRWGL